MGVHGAVIGRYEREEVKPSIEMAVKIAQAVGVSLDYLVGNSDLLLDQDLLKRMAAIQQLPPEDKHHLLFMMDALLRDAKIRLAYAS